MLSKCRRLAASLLLVLLTAVVFSLPVSAQVDQAAINGTVTDANGARVAGAQVELQSIATGLRRDTVTNGNGIYHFPGLPIGDYKLKVVKEGFRPVEVQNLRLEIAQPRTVDVRMEVGAVSSTIEITATGETLNR